MIRMSSIEDLKYHLRGTISDHFSGYCQYVRRSRSGGRCRVNGAVSAAPTVRGSVNSNCFKLVPESEPSLTVSEESRAL